MKNISILRIMTFVVLGLLVSDCNPSSKKTLTKGFSGIIVKKIISNENEIATAQKDTYSDFQKFIKEANDKLSENEMTINKLQIESNNLTIKDSEKNAFLEIADLKIDHNTLKRKLDNYVQNGNGNWQTFKTEFYCGLNELESTCDTIKHNYKTNI